MRVATAYLVTAIAGVLAADGAACTPGRSQGADEPTASSAKVPSRNAQLAQETAATRTRMEEHFARGAEAKAAIVRGDLESAKNAMSWLAKNEWTSNLRPDFRPHMKAIADAARAGAEAKDPAQAARALGRIGDACAACHVALGGPQVMVAPPPSDGLGTDFQPVRHSWAVDRMWEGLIAPSDEAWSRGAMILADAPLQPNKQVATRELPPELTVLSNRIHEYGRRAETLDVARRGDAFAEVITTCARCHDFLNIKLSTH